jgi:hypothetical protein
MFLEGTNVSTFWSWEAANTDLPGIRPESILCTTAVGQDAVNVESPQFRQLVTSGHVSTASQWTQNLFEAQKPKQTEVVVGLPGKPTDQV